MTTVDVRISRDFYSYQFRTSYVNDLIIPLQYWKWSTCKGKQKESQTPFEERLTIFIIMLLSIKPGCTYSVTSSSICLVSSSLSKKKHKFWQSLFFIWSLRLIRNWTLKQKKIRWLAWTKEFTESSQGQNKAPGISRSNSSKSSQDAGDLQWPSRIFHNNNINN